MKMPVQPRLGRGYCGHFYVCLDVLIALALLPVLVLPAGAASLVRRSRAAGGPEHERPDIDRHHVWHW
jgi:hypothetical protein